MLFNYRYEATIIAQFHGHTHFDEFEVYYDNVDFKRPVGIGYIAPSITPWKNCNPAYRIYYVDGDHENTTRVRFLIIRAMINQQLKFLNGPQQQTFVYFEGNYRL